MQITNGVHDSLRSACSNLTVLLLAGLCALDRPSTATARCRRRRRRRGTGRVRSFRLAAQRGEAGMTCQPAAERPLTQRKMNGA